MADARNKGKIPKKPTGSGTSGKKKKAGQIPVVKAGGGRQIPWLTIGGAAVVLLIIAGLALYLVPKYEDKQEIAKFTPSSSTPDPSDKIDGVTKRYYPAGQHIEPTQRVAYDQSPPFGGPHDASWATCTGIVYPNELRAENAVHSLEHGAVWITYNPTTIAPGDLDILKSKVEGEQYMLLSPYPTLDRPISVQSWGHQLKVDSAADERIGQFIEALRRNGNAGVYPENPEQAAYPEVGAQCSAIPSFDPSNPPAPNVGEPPADAVPMDGAGTTQALDESGMGIPAEPTPAG